MLQPVEHLGGVEIEDRCARRVGALAGAPRRRGAGRRAVAPGWDPWSTSLCFLGARFCFVCPFITVCFCHLRADLVDWGVGAFTARGLVWLLCGSLDITPSSPPPRSRLRRRRATRSRRATHRTRRPEAVRRTGIAFCKVRTKSLGVLRQFWATGQSWAIAHFYLSRSLMMRW